MDGTGTTAGAMPRGDRSGTRDRLLRAAVTVGARDGWGGVTTRAVATEAQLNPGLVHYHVGSVGALRREAVRTALDVVAAGALADLEDAADPADALRRILASVVGPVPGQEATAFVYEAFLAAPRDAELRALLADVVSAFRLRVAAWVDRVTAGTADRPDPVHVATVLVAAIDGLYLHRLLDDHLDVGVAVGPLARLVADRPS